MREIKAKLRHEARARRAALPDKDSRSARVWERLFALPAWRSAGTVWVYRHVGGEVRTDAAFAPGVGKRLAVPGRSASGEWTGPVAWPGGEVVPLAAVDLAIIPGVAFDRRGRRLGQGGGYYDRLLPGLRSDCAIVGLAFACQVIGEVPAEPHDVPVNWVATEDAVYAGASSSVARLS